MCRPEVKIEIKYDVPRIIISPISDQQPARGCKQCAKKEVYNTGIIYQGEEKYIFIPPWKILKKNSELLSSLIVIRVVTMSLEVSKSML